MKKLAIVILSAFFVSILFAVHLYAKERAIKVKLRETESLHAPVAEEVNLYSASYALVIGINNYTNGWPRLSGAVRDAEIVADVLKKKGFEVTLKKNLSSRALKQAFEEFFIFKGENPEARLFVWFAGHGHTLEGEGFLIPSDAPLPDAGARFKFKALSMRRFGEFVRLAKSKHALAVFDSCFSGTVFDTQRTAPPPAVTRATTLPVRQFLSSGDSNQTVSDDGRFCKLFIRAIQGEERADANRDGYLTGSELGLFLTDRLTNLTKSRQTPRYGKLRDEDWDRGDFVFVSTMPSQALPLSVKSEEQKFSEERAKLDREQRELEQIELALKRKKLEKMRKRLEAEKQELETDTLPQKSSHSRPSPGSSVVKRDGVYVAYANGIVRDTNTGLEWKAGPDKNTNWNQARSWVQSLNLDGGGWRMPTRDELEELYNTRYRFNKTSLLKTKGWYVWSGETEGSSESAWGFDFTNGGRIWTYRYSADGDRAFAVRSRSDG